ncbi:MAG: MarR family transcriptional regulator [Butyrivibrio sp.]|nr:MarR family transcriptional regulator [Butyrivibrio sp.]
MIDKTNYIMIMACLWRKFVSLYSDWAEAHGLSYYEFMILYLLNRQNRLMQKEVTAATEIPKQSISHAARRLCEKGLIEFVASQADRREKDMILTGDGARFVKENFTPLLKIEEEAFDRVGFEQIDDMVEMAKKFLESFDGAMNNKP